MGEVFDKPPEEEGDDSEAGGGPPTAPIADTELEDAPELDEDDEDDS